MFSLNKIIQNPLSNKKYLPSAKNDLHRLFSLLKDETPFTFIRFSDGEMEVLRNRFLEIGMGYTIFQGKRISNNFPEYDRKKYDPSMDIKFRTALENSATKKGMNYFKGIPTLHNNMIEDREYMVALNGGMSEFMTFSDLLINSNYVKFRERFVPFFASAKNLALVANHRAIPTGGLSRAKLISIGDGIFKRYEETLKEVLKKIHCLPLGAIVLSSASSFSNILGMHLYDLRPDITFIDIGTALNDLLSLKSVTRAYHRLCFKKSIYDRLFALRYRLTMEYWIRW